MLLVVWFGWLCIITPKYSMTKDQIGKVKKNQVVTKCCCCLFNFFLLISLWFTTDNVNTLLEFQGCPVSLLTCRLFWAGQGKNSIKGQNTSKLKFYITTETTKKFVRYGNKKWILKCVLHIWPYYLLNISLCFMANKNIKIKDATSLNWVSAFEIARIHYFYYCELILVFKN